MIALQYLYDVKPHPVAVYISERDGKANAALFTLGTLSHLAMMASGAASEASRGLAVRMEAAALDAQLPRASWGGLVDALRSGAPRGKVVDEMVAMMRAVAAATKE